MEDLFFSRSFDDLAQQQQSNRLRSLTCLRNNAARVLYSINSNNLFLDLPEKGKIRVTIYTVSAASFLEHPRNTKGNWCPEKI